MDIVSEKPVSLNDVKEILHRVQKDSKEPLTYEQQNTLDHVEKFVKLEPKKEKELRKDLKDLGFLSDRQIVSVADILPKSEAELRVILAREKLEFDEAQLKEVMKVVKKYK